MNKSYPAQITVYFPLILLYAVVSGCATTKVYEPLESLKTKYNAEKSTGPIREYAPVALYEIEGLIQKAEAAESDGNMPDLKHYTYMGEKTLELASAKAASKQAEDRIQQLSEERNQILLESRGMEAKRSREEAEKMRQQLESYKASEVEKLKKELEGYKSKKTDRGTILVLDNLLFDTGGATLLAGSQKNLEPLVKYLRENPNRNISIEGHTDSVGNDEFNRELSLRRADAVKQYLLQSGIEENRIRTRGFGEAYPVASNASSSGRQMNRRVEIVILN